MKESEMEAYQLDFNKAFKLFNTLNHPQKLWILTEVKEKGFLIGREIWKGLSIAQSVGSKFANELVELGLLNKKKVGSTFQFSLNKENWESVLSLSKQLANLKTN